MSQLQEKISLCGDDCFTCPRYNAHTDEELLRVAELWYRIGWRDRVVSNDEIKCSGCSSHKSCTYNLVECTYKQGVDKCSQCVEFPCVRIEEMLATSEAYRRKCRDICTEEEFQILSSSFFNKENNLKK